MEERDRLNILTILTFLILLIILWYTWTVSSVITIIPTNKNDFYYKHFFRHISPSSTFDNMNANNNYNGIL